MQNGWTVGEHQSKYVYDDVVIVVVGLIPEPGYLQQLVSTYPNMNDTSYTVTTQDTEVMKTSEGDLTPLAMP